MTAQKGKLIIEFFSKNQLEFGVFGSSINKNVEKPKDLDLFVFIKKDSKMNNLFEFIFSNENMFSKISFNDYSKNPVFFGPGNVDLTIFNNIQDLEAFYNFDNKLIIHSEKAPDALLQNW